MTSACVLPNKKTNRFQKLDLKKLIKKDSSKKEKIQKETHQKTQEKLKEGLLLFEKKDYKNSIAFFKKQAQESSAHQNQALFYWGFSLYERGQKEGALQILKRVLDEDLWFEQSLLLQWKILTSIKNSSNEEKLFILSQLIQKNSSLEVKNKARDIAHNLAQKTNLNSLKKMNNNSSFEAIKEILTFHVGRQLVQKKKYTQALAQFKKISRYSTDNIFIEEKAQQYEEALTARTKVNPYTVATILPLTGKQAHIGRRSLDGLQLGLGLFDKNPSSFQLIVKDSKGSNLSVQENIKDIFLQHQAIGIIGGVISQSALKLAQEAQSFMIPTILLSQKSNLTQAGSFIFQNALTSQHIVSHLTKTLVQDLDHKNLAILYPNDPFGVEYANLFWSSAVRQGAKIVAVQTYKTEETDFTNSVKRLTGTYYYEDRDEEFRNLLASNWFEFQKQKRNKKNLREILPPVVNFSAIFIPDSVKSLHQIAPYFNSQNVKDIIFTGPSLWNSPRLLSQKKKLLEGTVFADALITNHPEFKQSSFYKNFTEVFNYSPGLFEFLSYQSAQVFRQVIESGATSREELRDSLSQLKEVSSPVGQIQISKNREFIYPVTSLNVKNSTISPL